MTGLPRPGLVGIAIRLALAAAVLWMGISTLLSTGGFWDGFTEPTGSLHLLIVLAWFSSAVVNELLHKAWAWWPSTVLLLGLAAAIGAGALRGDPFGPAYGGYLWTWTVLFAALLGPALLLAAALRTPGCEMRAYLDLWTRMRGGDPRTVACKGWVDRFDHVRLFGKW